MTTTRRRRTVRRAAVALAAVALLPVGYVGAWLAVSRAVHIEIIRPHGKVCGYLPLVFAPLMEYSGSDRPGSRKLFELWWTVNPIERRGSSRIVMPSLALAPRDQYEMSMLPTEQLAQ